MSADTLATVHDEVAAFAELSLESLHDELGRLATVHLLNKPQECDLALFQGAAEKCFDRTCYLLQEMGSGRIDIATFDADQIPADVKQRIPLEVRSHFHRFLSDLSAGRVEIDQHLPETVASFSGLARYCFEDAVRKGAIAAGAVAEQRILAEAGCCPECETLASFPPQAPGVLPGISTCACQTACRCSFAFVVPEQDSPSVTFAVPDISSLEEASAYLEESLFSVNEDVGTAWAHRQRLLELRDRELLHKDAVLFFAQTLREQYTSAQLMDLCDRCDVASFTGDKEAMVSFLLAEFALDLPDDPISPAEEVVTFGDRDWTVFGLNRHLTERGLAPSVARDIILDLPASTSAPENALLADWEPPVEFSADDELLWVDNNAFFSSTVSKFMQSQGASDEEILDTLAELPRVQPIEEFKLPDADTLDRRLVDGVTCLRDSNGDILGSPAVMALFSREPGLAHAIFYNEDQPRAKDGKWTKGSGSGSSLGKKMSDAMVDNGFLDDFADRVEKVEAIAKRTGRAVGIAGETAGNLTGFPIKNVILGGIKYWKNWIKRDFGIRGKAPENETGEQRAARVKKQEERAARYRHLYRLGMKNRLTEATAATDKNMFNIKKQLSRAYYKVGLTKSAIWDWVGNKVDQGELALRNKVRGAVGLEPRSEIEGRRWSSFLGRLGNLGYGAFAGVGAEAKKLVHRKHMGEVGQKYSKWIDRWHMAGTAIGLAGKAGFGWGAVATAGAITGGLSPMATAMILTPLAASAAYYGLTHASRKYYYASYVDNILEIKKLGQDAWATGTPQAIGKAAWKGAKIAGKAIGQSSLGLLQTAAGPVGTVGGLALQGVHHLPDLAKWAAKRSGLDHESRKEYAKKIREKRKSGQRMFSADEGVFFADDVDVDWNEVSRSLWDDIAKEVAQVNQFMAENHQDVADYGDFLAESGCDLNAIEKSFDNLAKSCPRVEPMPGNAEADLQIAKQNMDIIKEHMDKLPLQERANFSMFAGRYEPSSAAEQQETRVALRQAARRRSRILAEFSVSESIAAPARNQMRTCAANLQAMFGVEQAMDIVAAGMFLPVPSSSDPANAPMLAWSACYADMLAKPESRIAEFTIVPRQDPQTLSSRDIAEFGGQVLGRFLDTWQEDSAGLALDYAADYLLGRPVPAFVKPVLF